MTRRQPKYAKKRDLAESGIVEALQATGCWVWRELPVDLLVRLPRDPPGILRVLECKTPRPSGEWSKDKRQQKQAEFIQVTGTKYATTPEQALRALGLVTGQPLKGVEWCDSDTAST
jgi:hypothetical protein